MLISISLKIWIEGYCSLSFTASGIIQTIIMDKQKSRIKVTEVFNISSKLRERDAVTVNGIRGRVESLTKSHPLELWDAIHVKGSKVSLVRTAYFKLKKTVFGIDPERVMLTEKLHELHKSKRKLIKEISQELQKVNGKPNDELIKSHRKKIAGLNKVIKTQSN